MSPVSTTSWWKEKQATYRAGVTKNESVGKQLNFDDFIEDKLTEYKPADTSIEQPTTLKPPNFSGGGTGGPQASPLRRLSAWYRESNFAAVKVYPIMGILNCSHPAEFHEKRIINKRLLAQGQGKPTWQNIYQMAEVVANAEMDEP